MKLYYKFIFLIILPACFVDNLAQYSGGYDDCPYAKEYFMSIVTLGGIGNYVKEDNMATGACFKEIELGYEEALDFFVTNMTKAACQVGSLYYGYENLLNNYPFLAAKALKELGIQMQKHYQLMKTAFREGSFPLVNQYELEITKKVYPKHDEYYLHLKHFEEKSHGKEEEVKSIIHRYCKDGMKKLLAVAKYFKLCMMKRLSKGEAD